VTELQQQQILASALRRFNAMQRNECIDPFNLDSRTTEAQNEVLKDLATIPVRAVIAANRTGKSSLGGREVAWVFAENHPYIDRNKLWGEIPLTILVLGKVGEQIESILWRQKIKPFLETGTYKEVRTGNALQRVEHKTNGNVIIFISHHNANEAALTAQGHTAQLVWIDEMPGSLSLIAELQTRTIANNGRLLLTFTPLLKNVEIKNLIEGLELPIGKKYKFAMLDNPIFKGKEKEILAAYAKYPENERRARLLGDWFIGQLAVYEFDVDRDVEELPQGYSKSWDHIEIVDPAASSKLGYLLLAQSPDSGVWFTAKALYIPGAAATDLIPLVLAESLGCKIVRRICDPHEVWYLKEAVKAPWNLSYMGVYKKNERKSELIKNLQQSITSGKTKACKHCPDLTQEAVSCQWSETIENKIVNASKYHLLDCWQYGMDNLPTDKQVYKPCHPDPRINYDIELRIKNEKRKKREVKAKANSRIKHGRRSRWKPRLHG